MPRAARKKSQEFMYHIMCRSISEADLFQDDADKSYYLMLIKRYKSQFCCKIYAYCLMDNHVHFYINPQGFDISTFMRCLNTAYVAYYNKKNNRHGILLQGRFGSCIVDNDTYSLTLSAYIHNNPKDLPDFTGKEEMYRYSSYGIYTGFRKDTEGIVDTDFVLEMFSQNPNTAAEKYRTFVESMRNTGIMKEVNDNMLRCYTGNEYRSEKCNLARPESPEVLMNTIRKVLGGNPKYKLMAKYIREVSQTRAFITYVMRVLCGYTYKEICQYIGNMSMSGISRLFHEGYKLVAESAQYQHAFLSVLKT